MSAAKGFVFPGNTVESSGKKTDEDGELNYLRIQNRVQRRMILKLKNENTKIKNSVDGKTYKLRQEIITLKQKTLHIEESLMMKIHLLEDSLEKEKQKQKSVIEDIFDVIDVTTESETPDSTPKKISSDPLTPKRKLRDLTIDDVKTPSKTTTKCKKKKPRKNSKVTSTVPVRRSIRSTRSNTKITAKFKKKKPRKNPKVTTTVPVRRSIRSIRSNTKKK